MSRHLRSVNPELAFCALLAVVAGIVFGKGVSPYLHSDDWVLLSWAPLQGIDTVTGWFRADIARVWGFRPAVLSLTSITSAFGTGYPQHVASLVFHLATSCLLFIALRMDAATVGIGRPALDRYWPAGAASLFFLVHPSHDEAVYWFSAIAYPMASFFGLSGWILCGSAQRGKRITGYAAFGIALLSHPAGAVFPFVNALVSPAGDKARRLSLLAAVISALFLAGSVALGSSTTGSTRLLLIGELPNQVAAVIAASAWFGQRSTVGFVVAGVLGLLALLAASRGNRLAVAALVISVVSGIMFASAFPGDLSPRYLYLPVLGISLLLGSILNRSVHVRPILVAYIVLVLVGGIGTNRRRASAWNDAGALGDRVFASLLSRLPTGPAQVVVAGEPDSLDGAYVFRHGLLDRVQRQRPEIQGIDLRLAVDGLADQQGSNLTLLFDGTEWRNVSGGANTTPTGERSVLLLMADLNGDGRGDALTYQRASGRWARHISNSGGGFSESAGTWAPGWSILPARFDGDALTDFFLFRARTGEWLKMRTTTSGFNVQASGAWRPEWQRFVLDLDGDGASDFFLYDPATGVWFKALSTPAGFTYEQGAWNPGWEIYPMRLNDDAFGDMFLFNRTTGRWFWALGAAGKGFSPASDTWLPGWQLYPGDFNGDGLSDLFLYNSAAGNRYVAFNNGAGFTYVAGFGWTPGWTPYVAELDGDGKEDLFLHNSATGAWFQMISDGAGNFTNVGGSQWVPGWNLHLSDFNGDRRADFLLYNPATGEWYMARNLVNGTFSYTNGTWRRD